jgi:hypothetical protein
MFQYALYIFLYKMLSIGTVQSKGNVSQSTTFVRFQVLMVEVIKMTAFWDVTPGNLVEVDLMMEATWISETSLCFNKTTRRYIPEGYHLNIGPNAGIPLVGHTDANRHALLNTRKLPVYSTCRLCQKTQTLNLLVVVQGQCTMGCAADESEMEGGFSAPYNWNLWPGE